MGKGASGETRLCPDVFRTRLSKRKSQSLCFLCSAGHSPLWNTKSECLASKKGAMPLPFLELLKRDRSMWGETAWGLQEIEARWIDR